MATRPSATTEPRARYDGKPSQPQPVAPPKYVENAGPDRILAWGMQQAGVEQFEGEVNDEEFRQVAASRPEARAMVNTWTYDVIGGPPGGYRGGALLDALPATHEAVTAARTVVRCIAYEAQLQAQAPALQRAVEAAQQAAEDAAKESVAADWERYNRQVGEMMNDPRNGGIIDRDLLASMRPPRGEPDTTEARRAQARLDRGGAEIRAVQRRKATADRIVFDTLKRIGDASARLLWMGPEPGPTPELPDWSAMYTAYDTLLELCGLERADEMMDKAVKRWSKQR